jgi:hypothetical protein
MARNLVSINGSEFKLYDYEEHIMDDILDLVDEGWKEEMIKMIMESEGYDRECAIFAYRNGIVDEILSKESSVIEIGGVILQFKE